MNESFTSTEDEADRALVAPRRRVRGPRSALAAAVIAVIGLAACGGGDDDAESISGDAAAAPGDQPASPFAEVTACLLEQGLDVDEPTMNPPDGTIPEGATPPSGSLPEGGMPPGGTLPGGTMPEGGFQPGGTLPGGSVPPDMAGAATDRMTELFGLDATDPDVAGALETCASAMGTFGPGGGGPPGAPPADGQAGSTGSTAGDGG